MSTSIYDLLENNPDLFDKELGIVRNVSCADLVDENEINGQSLVVSWMEARDQSRAYRDYLRGSPIPRSHKVNSFVIPYNRIMDLLNEMSDEPNDNKGIRVYIGLKPVMGGWAPRLFALPCLKDSSGLTYNDYQIDETFPPNILVGTLMESGPGEPRPCPDQCSRDNFMNTP